MSHIKEDGRLGEPYIWLDVNEHLPKEGQEVMCKYEGVYNKRLCHYFQGGFGNPFIGEQREPATHWAIPMFVQTRFA
jgi:hypothetical protein